MIKKSVFFIVVTLVIFGGQFFLNQGLVTGTPPSIKLATIQGNAALAPVGSGPGFIYFWAEWCGICNLMQETVSTLEREFPVMTVAVRSGGANELRHYLQKKQLSWPVVADNQGAISAQYGVRGVPVVFFINPQGDIVFSATGYTSSLGMRFRLWLAGIL